jgi:transposase-like protein
MAKKRRSFTREFKVEAVKLVTEKGYSFTEAARSLGITPALLHAWKTALENKGSQAFPAGTPAAAGRKQTAADGVRHFKKSDGILRQGIAVIFAFIEQHRDLWSVTVLCRTLGVSAGGFYAWRNRPTSSHQQRRDALVVEIKSIHAQVKQRYGSPRIHAELNDRGVACSLNTVAKLMHENGIKAQTARKFVTTTDSNHKLPVAQNILERQFDATKPNERWVADITYIPTREGWLYLAAVEDLYSRKVVGWSMADHLESRLVVDALQMAITTRWPEEGLLAPATVAASTPANTIKGSWASMGSIAA